MEGSDGVFKFDIALSFAGQDRQFADGLAKALRESGLSVFYDEFHKSDLWGAHLEEELSAAYYTQSKFAIIVVSRNYIKSKWPTFERHFIVARGIKETGNYNYILPVFLEDKVEVPGLPPTVGCISYPKQSIPEIVSLAKRKIEDFEKNITNELAETGKRGNQKEKIEEYLSLVCWGSE